MVVAAVAVAEHKLPALRLAGRVEAVQRGVIGFEVAGVVVDVLVDEGDQLVVGQPLARLDRTRLQAARDATEAQRQAAVARRDELAAGPRRELIDRARAAMRQAEVRLTLAESTAQRHREALASQAVTMQAEEAARSDAEVAAAALAQVRAELAELEAGTRPEQLAAQVAVVAQLAAQLQQLDRDLADCELRAPYAGRIEVRHIERGQIVAASAAAFQLVGRSELRVRVGVPAQLAASGVETLRTAFAEPGLVTVRGRAVEVVAAELQLLPEVDASARTVDLLLPLVVSEPVTADAAGLRHGELATVRVSAGSRTGIAVPVTALRAGPRGLFRCFVAEPVASEGGGSSTFRAQNRDLQVAEWLGERVLVTGGLVAGERLIVSGADHVLRGLAVVPTFVSTEVR